MGCAGQSMNVTVEDHHDDFAAVIF